MLDLAIIGSGPAAFAAAIYAARAGLKVKIFEKGQIGGALWQIAKIENYPGFIGSGADLADIIKRQAQNCGVTARYGEIKSISSHSGGHGRSPLGTRERSEELAAEPREDGREERGDESNILLPSSHSRFRPAYSIIRSSISVP